MRELLSAPTPDGERLTILDLTHPAFRVTLPEAEIERGTQQFVDESRSRPPLPDEVLAALRASRLGRAVSGAGGPFISGLATYLMKLGADHLWPGAGPMDRAIAGSFPALMIRLRTQDVSDLLADGLGEAAAAAPSRPLLFVNIGGGPASDSWNTLLRLEADRPGILARRRTRIVVFDGDAAGPRFGAAVVAALRSDGAPLAGVDVTLECQPYDWSAAAALPDLLRAHTGDDPLCAVSSEGALFEYGSDDEIAGNLRALSGSVPADAIVAGSVTRGGEPGERLRAGTGIAVHARTVEEFETLAEGAGWRLDRVVARPFAWHVRLRKAE